MSLVRVWLVFINFWLLNKKYLNRLLVNVILSCLGSFFFNGVIW